MGREAIQEAALTRIYDRLDAIESDTRKSLSQRIWDLVTRALASLAVAGILAGFAWVSAIEARSVRNHDRLTTIEATRFTAAQASAMASQISEKIAAIRPNEWLREMIDRQDVALRDIARELKELNARITKLESR